MPRLQLLKRKMRFNPLLRQGLLGSRLGKKAGDEVVAVSCAPDKEGKPVDPLNAFALAGTSSRPVVQPPNFKDKEDDDVAGFGKVRSHDMRRRRSFAFRTKCVGFLLRTQKILELPFRKPG